MVQNENILLVRLKSIGDILFTLPAVHMIRDNFPGAKITFLVSKEFRPLIEGFRDVNEVIGLDRELYRRKNPLTIVVETFSLLRRLRRQRFSLAVDFQGYGETAWLTRLSSAPRRWGCLYQSGRSWAYTHSVRHNRLVHPAAGNLLLLERGGLLCRPVRNEFVLPGTALDEARRFFAAQGLEATRPAMFIQPFTSNPKKNWPLEKFLELAQRWQTRGVQIVFGGGPSECAALGPARAAGFRVAAGEPLLTAAGLMKLSTLVVGADTGLLHLAVAMGRRVVMIIHSDAPGASHPFQHPDWALTPPAGKPVSEIQVAAVMEACERASRESAGPASA